MLPNLAMYFLVKFMFSKIRRPQKLMKSSTSIWHYVVSVKSTVKIWSIFVAFSENTNCQKLTFDKYSPHFPLIGCFSSSQLAGKCSKILSRINFLECPSYLKKILSILTSDSYASYFLQVCTLHSLAGIFKE